MNRAFKGLAILGIVLCAGQRAEAGSTYAFNFSYSSTPDSPYVVSGSGVLYGTANGDGSYTLTGGSGTSVEAGSLTLEVAGTYINNLAPSVDLISDNVLIPNANPVLDDDGIVFYAAGAPATSQYINIWGNGPDNYTYFNNYAGPYPAINETIDFTIDSSGPLGSGGQVPEPPSIVMGLGALLLTVACVLARRRKAAHAAAAA